MNPNTPPPSDDDLPDERELAAIYGRLPKDEPDAALDARVRAMAAPRVHARRRSRWPVAFGSAAAIVLALAVTWQLRDARSPVPAASHGVAPADALRERDAAPASPAPDAAPVATPAPAPPPPPAPPAAIAAETAKPSMRAEGRMAARNASPSTVMRMKSSPSPQAGAAASAFAPMPELAPDDRVGEIRRLLGSGQRELALRRLRELRERYPRYDLPRDLRDLTP
ncbi:translation initiation factor IF-2 [Luteibacter sp. UNCMF331Sha3.1]|uniref:hypothetical protein n=1 Tax=Luteibacter sp. UNCMF331Sha3.1 TaxID=1502760 RepID=UPI0008CDBBD5|nr:hypothetical protein [Luteibacter sp. UNCMF331Sha3.1]SEN35094.1 translation initiation factor IF-2 [Luteibacter sp. UNCMF331Sha3.1]